MSEQVFVFNAQADISDYKKIALDAKAVNTIIQNCTTRITLGKADSSSKKGKTNE